MTHEDAKPSGRAIWFNGRYLYSAVVKGEKVEEVVNADLYGGTLISRNSTAVPLEDVAECRLVF